MKKLTRAKLKKEFLKIVPDGFIATAAHYVTFLEDRIIEESKKQLDSRG